MCEYFIFCMPGNGGVSCDSSKLTCIKSEPQHMEGQKGRENRKLSVKCRKKLNREDEILLLELSKCFTAVTSSFATNEEI